jgi:hypothetical protein
MGQRDDRFPERELRTSPNRREIGGRVRLPASDPTYRLFMRLYSKSGFDNSLATLLIFSSLLKEQNVALTGCIRTWSWAFGLIPMIHRKDDSDILSYTLAL